MPKYATPRPYTHRVGQYTFGEKVYLKVHLADRNHNQLGTTFVRLEFTVGAGYGGEDVGSKNTGVAEYFSELVPLASKHRVQRT